MSVNYPVEGLVGRISFGGTVVGHLLGVNLSGDRSTTQYRAMGTINTTSILKGRRNFEGSAKKAYLCGEFLTLFLENCQEYSGSFFPRYGVCGGGATPCGTIAGTIVFKTWNLTGWEAEAEAAKIEEVTFDIYNISQPGP